MRHWFPGTCSALLRNPDVDWADIVNLPKAAAALVDERFSRCTSKVSVCALTCSHASLPHHKTFTGHQQRCTLRMVYPTAVCAVHTSLSASQPAVCGFNRHSATMTTSSTVLVSNSNSSTEVSQPNRLVVSAVMAAGAAVPGGSQWGHHQAADPAAGWAAGGGRGHALRHNRCGSTQQQLHLGWIWNSGVGSH